VIKTYDTILHMRRRFFRAALSVCIVGVTGVVLVRYLQSHPAYLTQLKQTDVRWVAAILAADIAAISALAFLGHVLVQMTGKRLGVVENWLLTIYSSIVNFFGPLQSGPGVRAAYLKAKHGVSLRSYFLATLFAYAVFAILSAAALLAGTRPWWQTIIACGVVGGVSFAVIRFFQHRSTSTLIKLSPQLVTGLIGCTAFQILFLSLRYYAALHASGAAVSLGQAISYTGAANFAVFVSLTPDGVGIREAFLLFSQNIHHVSTVAIVSANIIDRAVFMLFLGILFMLAGILHAHKRFTPSPPKNGSGAKDKQTYKE